MKNLLLTVSTLIIAMSSYAQWSGSTDVNGSIQRNGNIRVGGLDFGRYGSSLVNDPNPYTIATVDGERHDLVIYGGGAATLDLRIYDGDLKLGSNANPYSILYNSGGAYFSGNLGLGVGAPQGKLHVNGVAYIGNQNQDGTHRIAIGGSGGSYGSVGYGYSYTTTSSQYKYAVNDFASQLGFDEGGFTFRAAPYGTSGTNVNFTEVVKVLRNGKVGFGTSTPTEVIHVAPVGNSGRVNARIGRWASFGETFSGLATIIGTNVKASNDAVHRMEFIESTVDGGKAIKMQYNEGISFHTYLGSVTAGGEFNGYERMRIDNNGNVGIGTVSPDAKLAVKGTVHAQEVKVDLLVPGPDYVFEPTYNLPTLAETEAYIKANKHLPEVPSAKEMESNGINLSEMNMLLLKKVEELTLHVIEQQKQIDELKKNK